MKGYDIGLDRQSCDPLNIMLDNINPGSKILEFGCANGRMTQYLTETMDCSVDIVEYDLELYSRAIEFADEGVCGDICDYVWVERFQNKLYDYIIFADVLEHLSAPHDVLKKCYKLLKESGIIWVSVPNIAYNDIIIKLLDDRFDYSSTGLLDSSHVHFFTQKSAKEMFADSGYYIAYEDGVFKQTFCSEQLLTKFIAWKPEYSYLLRRDMGELYQAVFALSKTPDFKLNLSNFSYYRNASQYYERRIYIDRGSGYDEAIITQELYENEDLEIDIPILPDTSMLWICPAFKKRFIIKDLLIYADERPIDYCKINAERCENDYYFNSLESFLYVSDLKGCSMVKIRGKIIFPDRDNFLEHPIREIFDVLMEENEQLQIQRFQTEAIKKTYEQEIMKLKKDIELINLEMKRLRRSLKKEKYKMHL